MSDLAYIDLETRSRVDLPKRGSYPYWEDDSTDVLIACYAIDDGPVKEWVRGDEPPEDLMSHIRSGGMCSGWNSNGFERLAFNHVLGPKYGWAVPDMEKWTDTMQMAVAMSLPGSLEKAAQVLGLDAQKDKEGKRLIRLFSIPKKDGSFNEPEDHAADFRKFIDYCLLDVEVEREARSRLVPLSDREHEVTVMDSRINERGIRIDVESAKAAVRLAEAAKKKIDREIRDITNGAVRRASDVARMKTWLSEQGVEMDSLSKSAVDDMLKKEDTPSHVKEVLGLRAEGGKTSVTKIKAFLTRASDDGRVRGSYSYHGATTGRWTSRGVNMANLPRTRWEYEAAGIRTDVLFDAIRTGDPDYMEALYGSPLGRPMHLLSDAVRGFLWAAPGHDLVQADYSGIEGAVIAWLAREEWKLTAMRGIIEDPSTPDMYRQTAARIMNTTTDVVTKKHPYRQSIGKTSELALGFGGGASAFVAMATNYRVNLDEIYGPVWGNADEDTREKAVRRFEFCYARNQSGARAISREAWIACEIVKRGWREQNSAIAQSWKDMESAAREAIEEPGTVTEAARCKFVNRFGYLWMLLPSGRPLCFPNPSLSSQVWVSLKDDNGQLLDAEVMDREKAERLELKGLAEVQGSTSPAISYWGVENNRWSKKKTYGGDLIQSATQATARDLLVNGMFRAEAKGYPIIAHVYDEIIAEVPRGFGDLSDFEREICILPEWADGLPLTAGGWRGKRFRKD